MKMKKLFLLLFACILLNMMTAQRGGISDFGKEGDASITLIDNELTVFEDGTNSILKFEIINDNDYPIYIPTPELKSGTIPQYFDLRNESIECEFEFMEMATRNSSEFIFIPANTSKALELHKEFFKNSCLKYDRPDATIPTYRASNYKEQDAFFTIELMKKNRDSRDIIEYLLTTKLKSEPIKIIYK